jgi:hypothetical protein
MAFKTSDVRAGKYLPYVIGLVALLIGLWFYRKFFGTSPAQVALLQNETETIERSKNTMANGMTYAQCANELLHMMWWIGNLFGIIPSHSFNFKNTDEKALGALMLSVGSDEFPLLSDAYLVAKKAERMSNSDSLRDDLVKTFNSSEQAQYLSHLRIL